MSKKQLRTIAPYILLAGVVLLFFWPLWLLDYSMPRGGGDLWGQLAPVWRYVAKHLRNGSFALWSTQMMAGDPLIGEAQYGLFNPLNTWLFLLGDFPNWVILVRGILPLWLAGAGLYTYLKRSDLWQMRDAAALTGALTYMLADSFITHIGHPHFNDAMAWLPWSLIAIDAVIRQRRVIWWASLPIAAVALAGHFQASLLALSAVAFYAVWRLVFLQTDEERWINAAGKVFFSLAINALCSAALTMPMLIPSLERYPFSERAILQLEPGTGYQWNAQLWIDLIAPGFHGRGIGGYWASWPRVESGYAGAVALLLAMVGLVSDLFARKVDMPQRRRQRAWFMLLLAVVAILFALGFDGPLFPLLSKIDLIARMGKTARAIYLLSFAIALGAAAGMQALSGMKYKGLAMVAAGCVLVAVMVLTFAPTLLASVPGDRRADSLASLRLAVGLAVLAGIFVLLPLKNRHIVSTALFLLLAGELILTGSLVEVEPVGSGEPTLAIQYLQQDPHWFRVDVDTKARGLLSPSVVLGFGFDVPVGTGNPMELYSYNQFYWAVPTKGAPVYQLLGAKYIIVPSDAQPGGEGIWPVFVDDPAVDVHLNTNALPRVWLVYDTVPVTSIEEANTILFNAAFEPDKLATVENGPDLNGTGEGIVEVRWYAPNKAAFFVRSSSDVLLVLSDMVYPGWKADIDGESVNILKTDAIFRGVIVPAGEHTVTMRYQPSSLQVGLGLSALGWLVILYSYTHNRKKNKYNASQSSPGTS